MDIREIDVFDDAQLHEFYGILREAQLFERPGAPLWSEREMQVLLRHEDPLEKRYAIAGYDGDRMVAAAEVFEPLLDNTDKTYFEINVAPRHRRRGYGGAMVADIVDRARAAGRPILLGGATLPLAEREAHPYARFARKHGFALASVEVRRDLALPVSAEQISDWEEEAAPHHSQYRLETFVDDIPDELLESYCALTNQLAVDAPTGDIEFEAEGTTPETFRVRQQVVKEQGRTVFETLALDEAGDVVGESALAVSADDPVHVHQWSTIVHKAHRGHRLGLAVKARNLRELQHRFPDRQRIVTTNSEQNDQMLAINIKMGFEPVELAAEFQRKL